MRLGRREEGSREIDDDGRLPRGRVGCREHTERRERRERIEYSRPTQASAMSGRGWCPLAWPFLVGGAICLVNSVHERDLSLLTGDALL
jgi:hypothetical protein